MQIIEELSGRLTLDLAVPVGTGVPAGAKRS